MVKKFEVYINVEDVYSFRVEAENEEAVDELIQELFDEYGMDFHSFLTDPQVDKGRHDVMTDYQIDILEIIPQHKVDELLERKITERMKWEDLND
tara:strand:+ start:378 stop:662 length:285 start_codon:yes stop_codon:yes gene_type:complete